MTRMIIRSFYSVPASEYFVKMMTYQNQAKNISIKNKFSDTLKWGFGVGVDHDGPFLPMFRACYAPVIWHQSSHLVLTSLAEIRLEHDLSGVRAGKQRIIFNDHYAGALSLDNSRL